VAYVVRETNWTDDEYQNQIWLADVATGAFRQLTRAKKSSDAPAFSPDGAFIGFLSDRAGKRQVYRIDPRGGEAETVTKSEEDVRAFAWAPDGRSIAYTAMDPKPQSLKDRESRYGELEVVDEDHLMSHLHLVDLATGRSRRLTEGPFAVGRFAWSPDGKEIAFDHRINLDFNNDFEADLSIVSVADAKVRPLLVRPGEDFRPLWSPDGRRIAFVTTGETQEPYFYTTTHLAVIDAAGGPVQVLPNPVDESPIPVGWGPAGIFFWTFPRTWAYLYRQDVGTGRVTRYAPATEWLGTSFSLSRDDSIAAFVAADARTFPEVYAAPLRTMQPKKLSDLGAQTAVWPKTTREIATWKSEDGTPIEGVLHKPADFQPGHRYPLLVVLHGGPATASRPVPCSQTTDPYPIDVWLNKGAIVLEPNYRGGSGYGEKFRMLNIRNLGVGDAWDVLSGIDALVERGLADKDRVGSMGWSQGGYISAFLTTRWSDRVKAVSVGAGVTDWTTYYVNTDIHLFTRRYLKATPWDDPEIYAKTSPITYLKQARTPTLIQHGSNDPRVPTPNAYLLYQALRDQGVPVRLIVYKGFGHTLGKPKTYRAAMEENVEFFGEHIFGMSASSARTQ
jgi:dipeptidyl aminopeptidase/acylaminoacyl peptidase